MGGDAEVPDDPPPAFLGTALRRGKRWRRVGIFQHGWSLIVAALLNHQLLPVMSGRSDAWLMLQDICGTEWTISAVGGGG